MLKDKLTQLFAFLLKSERHDDADFERIQAACSSLLHKIGSASDEELTPFSMFVNEVCSDSVPKIEKSEPVAWPDEIAHVFLAKPATTEQLQIVQTLHSSGSVVVQAFAGSVKTVAIGNVIGHLLSEGKRVLVTAQSVQDLEQLRDAVPEELRAFCVNSLHRHQLQETARALGEICSATPCPLESMGAQREKQIDELKHARLRFVRETSIRHQPYPVEAAKWLVVNEPAHGWIPGSVTIDAPLPLDAPQFKPFFDDYHRSVSLDDQVELGCDAVELASLISPEQFRGELQHLRSFQEMVAAQNRLSFWQHEAAESLSQKDRLQHLRSEVSSLLHTFEPAWPKWKIEAAQVSWGLETILEAQWKLIIETITETKRLADEHLTQTMHRSVHVEAIDPEAALKTCERIVIHFQSGNRLDWYTLFWNPDWKALQHASLVGDCVPHSVSEFQQMSELLKLKVARKRLVHQWKEKLDPLEIADKGDSLGSQPEIISWQYVEKFQEQLHWNSLRIQPILQELEKLEFKWSDFYRSIQNPAIGEYREFRKFQGALRVLLELLEFRLVQIALIEQEKRLEMILKSVALGPNPGATMRSLHAAVLNHDPVNYETAYRRIEELEIKRAKFDSRNRLLARLAQDAPDWAAAIRNRSLVDKDASPDGLAAAWEWKQWEAQLNAVDSTSPGGRRCQIRQLTDELNRATRQLAVAKPHAAIQDRARRDPRAFSALQKWVTTLAASEICDGPTDLKAAAIEQRKEALAAVPVWIMPISVVLKEFQPGKDNFDVVILTDACQPGLIGLLPLFMGKQLMIVGEEHQVGSNELKSIYQLAAKGIQEIITLQKEVVVGRADQKISQTEFEKEVSKELQQLGYRVKPHLRIGQLCIDLLVEGASSRVALELDGVRNHQTPDEITRELYWRCLLEDMGWEFIRIPGTAFYRNRGAALQPLLSRLVGAVVKESPHTC